MARWLIVTGLVILGIGLVVQFAPGMLNWFGRLPGDIRIESARGRFYFPLTSMVVVSLLLTLLFNLFRR